MILTDELADRIHRMQIEVLKLTQEGYEQVRSDTSGEHIGTGYALFAGEGSPLTQAFGFGYRSFDNPALLDRFYAGKGENWEVTVNPFTSHETLRALTDSGYRPSHFEGNLVQETSPVEEALGAHIEEVGPADRRFMEATWRGWSGNESDAFVPDDLVNAVSLMRARRYLAFVDGEPAASASLCTFSDGVILAGAATRVPFRGRGLQKALLARRLRDARPGRLALMGAVPGTMSYRNAQRSGFTPIFSSMVWMRR